MSLLISGEGRSGLADLIGNDMAWVNDSAVCAQVDAEIFFPHKGLSLNDAKRLCRRCPLQAPCLEYALTHDVWGVWGGSGNLDRRRMGVRVA